jgi:hypothetical protein
MYTSNNQVIFEETYDETFQPTDEELNEYAEFIGINPPNVIGFESLKVLLTKS